MQVDLEGLDLQLREKRAAAQHALQVTRAEEGALLGAASRSAAAALTAHAAQAARDLHLSQAWQGQARSRAARVLEADAQRMREEREELLAASQCPLLTEELGQDSSPQAFKGLSEAQRAAIQAEREAQATERRCRALQSAAEKGIEERALLAADSEAALAAHKVDQEEREKRWMLADCWRRQASAPLENQEPMPLGYASRGLQFGTSHR
uniref:Uncharacterized protein n=1 Tax=Auxenochlorella protothecoides TaxID=3075 RepID=A0A1D1ZMU0_AUXPR